MTNIDRQQSIARVNQRSPRCRIIQPHQRAVARVVADEDEVGVVARPFEEHFLPFQRDPQRLDRRIGIACDAFEAGETVEVIIRKQLTSFCDPGGGLFLIAKSMLLAIIACCLPVRMCSVRPGSTVYTLSTVPCCDGEWFMILQQRALGESDLRITPVGIGTAPIGSTATWRISWGPQDEQAALRAIHTALDQGVNWIDTAPFYGWGRAEELIGRAIQGRREQVLLFTKCGTLPDGQGGWVESLTPDSIRNDVEHSLRRLRTDHLDVLYLHDPDPQTPIEESWHAVQRLIRAGSVRYAGLSNHPIDLLSRARTIAPVTVVQHQYNLLNRDVEGEVLPYVQRHGIGFLAWSPLASGFLADSFDLSSLAPQDFRRRHPYADPETYAKLTRLRQELQPIAASRGKSLVDLALTWLWTQPGVTGTMVGIRNAREAAAMVAGLAWQLTDAERTGIQQAIEHWDG